MTNYEDFDEDSMPVPCQKCGEWFDLNDGCRSDKWFPMTVICYDCSRDEETEMDFDNEIEIIKNSIDDYKTTIENCKEEIEHSEKQIKENEERLEEIYKTYKPDEL